MNFANYLRIISLIVCTCTFTVVYLYLKYSNLPSLKEKKITDIPRGIWAVSASFLATPLFLGVMMITLQQNIPGPIAIILSFLSAQIVAIVMLVIISRSVNPPQMVLDELRTYYQKESEG
jgi:hypothetical protein